ncbi:MAG: Na+/H+ antiporter NhaA [Bradymonadia bacterium]
MRGIKFLLDNSMFLIIGAVGALIWANVDYEAYHHLVHLDLFHNGFVGHAHGDHYSITPHYIVNDILMALFFGIAGKEVWEATLPGGPLNNPKQAAAPLIATIGGMAGPALVFVLVAVMAGEFDALGNGWAVPTATDIAFSYMVARIVFGGGHPAIPFLLLLAIADDALGLVILAVFYTSGAQPIWLLLVLAGIIVGVVFRRMKISSFWPYLLIPGILSWVGMAKTGVHPALALVPIIPTMPHAHSDSGLFNWKEMHKTDTLNAFEHWWKNPVEIILGFFGLFNAGVQLGAMGTATTAVVAGLFIGKPLGIWVMGYLAKLGGFKLPVGMNYKDLFVVGCAAGIGFTVALFVATVAFKTSPGEQGAAKMGALLSFGAAILTVIAAKVMGVQKVAGNPPGHGHGEHH